MEHDLSIWYKNTTEKILAWRMLRQDLTTKTVDTILTTVNTWWTFVPWVKNTLDPYRIDTWPTPWQLIEKGEFCRNAIALGQAYTLWLCAPTIKTELWLVNNFSEKEVHLVAVVDDKHVLNYTLGQVTGIENCDFEVLNKIAQNDISHIKL